MKRLTALLALAPSMVLAHAGDHRSDSLLHFLSEPDHLGLIALGAAVLGYAVWKLWSRS
jgi:hypothetical protein